MSSIQNLQNSDLAILTAIRAARAAVETIGDLAAVEGAELESLLAEKGALLARIKAGLCRAASAAVETSQQTVSDDDFTAALAPLPVAAPQTTVPAPVAVSTAESSTEAPEVAPATAQGQQTASKPARKTRTSKASKPAPVEHGGRTFPCHVCGADIGFDAPSGVCSTSCLERAQGFAPSANGAPIS